MATKLKYEVIAVNNIEVILEAENSRYENTEQANKLLLLGGDL